MGSEVGWEMAKTISWGILVAAMMPLGTHTMVHALLVGHTAVGVILPPNWYPPLVPVVTLRVSKKPSIKADHFTVNHYRYTGNG